MVLVKSFYIFSLFFLIAVGAVTQDQLRRTGKIMRDACQPKFNVANEIADNIKNGIFPDEQNVKCYINCMLEMMQSMKKGKLNYDTSMKQIDMRLPERMKQPMRDGLNACKNSAEGIQNHCEAAYAVLKCFYKNIPEFNFP